MSAFRAILLPMQLDFSGQVFYWRGPSPYHFVAMPGPEAAELRAVASLVTYGWGVIPAEVRVGRTRFATSLFPRDGGYAVPIKVAVRRAEGIDVGDAVTLQLTIDGPR